jgi:hypothetical protein
VKLRRRSWRWLLWSLVVLAGGIFVGFSPDASGFKDDVAYTRVPVPISASAVVNVRALARLDRLSRRDGVPASAEPAEPPEPQEKAEPSVRITVPSPPVFPLSVLTVQSPFVSASFLAQTDAPLIGRKTESPPDTNGAVGRDKLMVPLNSNYVIQRKSDGTVLSKVTMTSFWGAVGAHKPFDPRVLYDPYSDRWLASAADDPLLRSSRILYGISDTGDPQGSWHLRLTPTARMRRGLTFRPSGSIRAPLPSASTCSRPAA